MRALPRGCKTGYSCTQSDLVTYGDKKTRCTRCRSLFFIKLFPAVAFALLQKVIQGTNLSISKSSTASHIDTDSSPEPLSTDPSPDPPAPSVTGDVSAALSLSDSLSPPQFSDSATLSSTTPSPAYDFDAETSGSYWGDQRMDVSPSNFSTSSVGDAFSSASAQPFAGLETAAHSFNIVTTTAAMGTTSLPVFHQSDMVQLANYSDQILSLDLFQEDQNQ